MKTEIDDKTYILRFHFLIFNFTAIFFALPRFYIIFAFYIFKRK